MDAGGIDGFLNVHLEIDNVDDCLQNSRDDAGSAWRAENEDGLAVPGDDRRAHRASRCLVRRNRVRVSLDNPVTVGQTCVRREIIHFVVHQHTGAGGHDPRSEPVIERIGHRNCVAGIVDNREVRRVAAFVRRNTLPDIAGDFGLVRFYGIPDLCGISLVDQLRDRMADKIRIAKKTVSIGKGGRIASIS